MFNNYSFRYSSFSGDINYFYDALRREHIDTDVLLSEYMEKIFSKISLSDSEREKSENYLRVLFKNKSLVFGVDELLKIFDHYNLNVKSSIDIANSNSVFSRKVKEILLANEPVDHRLNGALMRTQSYKLDKYLLENPEAFEKFNNEQGNIYDIERVRESVRKFESNQSETENIISEHRLKEDEVKKKTIIPPFNHSVFEIEDAAKRAKNIIYGFGDSIDRSILLLDWATFFTKQSKYLRPLFNEIKLEDKKEESLSETSEIKDLLLLSQDEFVKGYLKLSDLSNMADNYNFINRLNELWRNSRKDINFIDKLRDIEGLVIDGKRLKYSELNDYLNKDPFQLSKTPGGSLKVNVYWYYDNKDNYSEGSRFTKNYLYSLEVLKNARSGFSDNPLIYEHAKESVKVYRSTTRVLNKFEEYWNSYSSQETKYNMSLKDLFEIYYRVERNFRNFHSSQVDGFYDNYFDDPKFKKIFDPSCKFNFIEKFQLILEDYVSENLSSRLDVVRKLVSPNYFKFIKSKYPDLLEKLSLNKINEFVILDFNILEVYGKVCNSLDLSESEMKRVYSEHFSEFNLLNSSYLERDLFSSLEKLDLYAVPASQVKNLIMNVSDGKKTGFRIDFLLPCNVRKYSNDGSYTLEQDIIFIGEYFGFYGQKYLDKTKVKMDWQNDIESSLGQKCLHLFSTKTENICRVLKEKNIDCKCFSDYSSGGFNIKDIRNKKIMFINSQIHNFVYSYLINDLLYQINYDYSKMTISNLNSVKNSNKFYINEFSSLLSLVDDLSPIEIVKRCNMILFAYENKFKKEQKKRTANYKVKIR
jgi:hypothetical protein